MEISGKVFFCCKSRALFSLGVSCECFFMEVWKYIMKTFFGVSHVHYFFVHFFSTKKRRTTRTTQQPPLLPEEVKHIAPMDILGISITGKAMELWHEG